MYGCGSSRRLRWPVSPGHRPYKKAQMKRSPIKRKFHKYKAKKSASFLPELSGRTFPSRLERRVAEQLCILQRDGKITDLKFQDTVHLTRANIAWKIDFSYIEDGQKWYHEAKGAETYDYLLKKKLYKVYGSAPLRISKAGRDGIPQIIDNVFPEDFIKPKRKRK